MRWKLLLSLWVGLLLTFLGVLWYQLQSPHYGLMIPMWFKHTPFGMIFVTLDVWTKHEYCHMVVYGENPTVTWLWFALEVYTIGLIGYILGRKLR